MNLKKAVGPMNGAAFSMILEVSEGWRLMIEIRLIRYQNSCEKLFTDAVVLTKS